MSIFVSNCQHCDEQQFQTLSNVHYTIFSVVKLDLFIRALLLDRILALEKTTCTPHVHLVIDCNCMYIVLFVQYQPLKSLRSVQISILEPKNYPRSFKN